MIRRLPKDEYGHKFYGVPHGNPALHDELEWYATDDNKILGVVILDLIDNDFSWVIMTQNEQGPGFTAVDVEASLPSQYIARTKLHLAMENKEWEKN